MSNKYKKCKNKVKKVQERQILASHMSAKIQYHFQR
jgi:hypothetical protein